MAYAISNHFLAKLLTDGVDLTDEVEARLLMSNTTALADIPDADTVSAITTLDECDSVGYAAIPCFIKTIEDNNSNAVYGDLYNEALDTIIDELSWTALPVATRDLAGVLFATTGDHAIPNLPLIYKEFEAETAANGDDFILRGDGQTRVFSVTHPSAVTSQEFIRLLLTVGFDLTADLEVALLMTNTTLYTEAADADDIGDITTLDEMGGANYVRKPIYLKTVENDASNRADMKSYNSALDAAVNRITWSALGAGARSVGGFAIVSGSGHAHPGVIVAAKQFGSAVAANGEDWKLNLSANGVAQLAKA